MVVKSYTPNAFVPTTARTGGEYPSVFRGENGFIRGQGDNTFFECYGGSLDLNETIPTEALTGTISFSPASQTVTGVGTFFKDELHLGTPYLMTIAGELISVEEVLTQTTFKANEFPLLTGAGVVAHRLPIMFELNTARGTLLSGNAVEVDQGNILAVGSGTLRRNGSALSSSLVASKQAKIAIYNPVTNTYLIQTLGFLLAPVGVTIAASAAPTAKTFVDGDVNTGTDTVTEVAHGFVNGQKVNLTTTGVLPVTSPAGEFIKVSVFIIRVDADNVKFAETLAGTVGTPVPINITSAVGGGTHTITPVSKAMPAGERSLLFAKASTKLGTPSFGNPTEKIKFTLTAGQGAAVAFPAMDSDADPNDPHDAYRVYGSRFGGTTSTATANADSGPWYYIRTVTAAELGGTAGGTYYLEYLDAEIDGAPRIVTFDNDYPPRAEFVAMVAGYPVLVSCQGKGTVDYPDGDAPGPSMVPFKVSNLAAAPLVLDTGLRNEVPTSPPEIIIGFYVAAGRLYLMTANTLQIGVFTGSEVFPIATRPFWKSGFRNPHALCFADDTLYGFTNAPIRSPEEGSDASIDKGFSAPVKELTYDWHPSRVLVKDDPLNKCVCYIYSGAYKNAAGFWVSVILPFMLETGQWSMPIIVSSNTSDRVICGAATVNGRLEFLAGGRDGAGGIVVNTYRFDGGYNGEPISYYFAPQFADDGSESRPKKIKYPRVTGKFTNATFGIHGAFVGEAINVAVLEAGNAGSKTGAISIPNSSDITIYERMDVEQNDLMVYSFRVDGEWDGTGIKDRCDEVILESFVVGSRR